MNQLSSRFPVNRSAMAMSRAVAAMLVVAAPAARAQQAADLSPVVVTGKAADTPPPTKSAPSQNSLAARSAQSTVSDDSVRNYTSPVSDYTQVLSMVPGLFSYSPNGAGLGDSKITIRGLPDSYALFSFDGIPFNDTNGVSHHSWVFFPTEFLGGAIGLSLILHIPLLAGMGVNLPPGLSLQLNRLNRLNRLNLLARLNQ